MNRFKIFPERSWYTNPTTNNRQLGRFISKSTDAFYHSDYHGGNESIRNTIGTTENIICTLKNQFHEKSKNELEQAEKNLITILEKDLPQILQETGKNNLYICVIPRARAEKNYTKNQLTFKLSVANVAHKLNGFIDGTNYIIRHTDTQTTHLARSGHGGGGNLPYPGITNETCKISSEVDGKDILLIDDLYTKSVNIDEDAIQSLFDNGANSVVFYSIGKTL